jgi:ABC-2 type transport system ATP-binding protein
MFTVINQSDNYAELIPKDKVEPERILRDLVMYDGLHIETFDVQRSSLDEIFVKIYGEEDEKNA